MSDLNDTAESEEMDRDDGSGKKMCARFFEMNKFENELCKLVSWDWELTVPYIECRQHLLATKLDIILTAPPCKNKKRCKVNKY